MNYLPEGIITQAVIVSLLGLDFKIFWFAANSPTNQLNKTKMKTKIFRIGKDLILPERNYGAENSAGIEKGKCTYFIYGKGWLKAKLFTVEEIELPDEKDNILQIAECIEKYGKDVAYLLITNNAQGWRRNFNKKVQFFVHTIGIEGIKKIPTELLNILPIDWMLCSFGICVLDVIELDKNICKIDDKYFPGKCLYDGKSASLSEVIKSKWGEEACTQVEKLLK